MKWLVPTIVGGVVLVIGISFARAHKAAALASQADANVQVVAALAAQSAANAKSDDAVDRPNKSAPATDQPAASKDASRSASEKADKPALAAEDAISDPSQPGQEAGPAGIPGSQSDSPTKGLSGGHIFKVKHHAAASLADVLKKIWPAESDNIYVDPKKNYLIFRGGLEPEFRDILKKLDQPEFRDILKKLDQPAPRKTVDPRSETDGSPRLGDFKPTAAASKPEPAATELPTPKSDSQTNGPGQTDVAGNPLLFHVRHHDAASLVELIKRMHPKGDKMYADPRNNVLIFPDGIEQRFLDILQELDQPRPNHLQPQNAQTQAGSTANPLVGVPVIERLFDRDEKAPADTTNSPEAQEYRQYDAQAVALANAYRQQLATAPQDAQRRSQLKSELQGAVHAAFHARQSWQLSQAAQLRTRLEQIERRISERGKSADEIIQRRIDELLHPEKEWEQESDAAQAGPAGNLPQESILPRAIVIEGNKSIKTEDIMKHIKTRADQAIDPRQLKDDVRALVSTRWFNNVESRIENTSQGSILIIRVNERTMRDPQPSDPRISAGTEATEESVSNSASTDARSVDPNLSNRTGNGLASAPATGPVRDLDSPANPRRRVLDSALELNSAHATIDQAKALLADSEQSLKRLQSLAPGTIPQKTILDAELDVKHKRIGFERLVADLEIKQRQFEDAKEMLAAQIKFLEIDLADAKLRLQHADDDLSGAVTLYKNAAISNEKYNAKLLAQRLAASQYERAQLLLELYRKAIPDKAAPVEKDQSNAEPQFKDVWLTDFAAADEQSRKLHRPLVVYFWAKWSGPDQKMKAEVIPHPDVVRILAKNFVAVIVNVDQDPKTVKQFNIQRIPTVLVLNEGRELGRTQGLITPTTLVDELKRAVPLSRTDSSAEAPATVEPAQTAAEEKPVAPRPGGSDAVSDVKATETTPKADNRSNDKPQE